jgi:hypothetical protein
MGWLTNVLIAMRDMKLMQLRAESELRRRGKFPPRRSTRRRPGSLNR